MMHENSIHSAFICRLFTDGLLSGGHQAKTQETRQWTSMAFPARSLQSNHSRGQGNGTSGIPPTGQTEIVPEASPPIYSWHQLRHFFFLFYVSVDRGSRRSAILPKMVNIRRSSIQSRVCLIAQSVQSLTHSFSKSQTLPSVPSSVFWVCPICGMKRWMPMLAVPKQASVFLRTTCEHLSFT